MSLDQNLFTLILAPNKSDPNVIDLVDPSETVHYRKRRLPGPMYKAEVYDPMSGSLLVTASAPASTSKVKILELFNPTMVVEMKYTGSISFRWSFKWEEHEFEWKREECFMLRKPDPPVLVAITKEPSGRLKSTSVQILDYNLNRFDIDDRKGLEIVILTALLTFQDANETYHKPVGEASSSSTSRKATGSLPPSPPTPAAKSGIERIKELQALRGEYNEVTVEEDANVKDYAQYCADLLEDDAMLFVTVRSASADQVPKVLQVVEETKRIRHKTGLFEEQELHQYVLYDTAESHQKTSKRIVLDDKDKGKDKTKDKNKADYTPPKSLTIHLSKIPMPELQPTSTKKKELTLSTSSPPPSGRIPRIFTPQITPKEFKPTRRTRSASPMRITSNQPSPSPSLIIANIHVKKSPSSSPRHSPRPSLTISTSPETPVEFPAHSAAVFAATTIATTNTYLPSRRVSPPPADRPLSLYSSFLPGVCFPSPRPGTATSRPNSLIVPSFTDSSMSSRRHSSGMRLPLTPKNPQKSSSLSQEPAPLSSTAVGAGAGAGAGAAGQKSGGGLFSGLRGFMHKR